MIYRLTRLLVMNELSWVSLHVSTRLYLSKIRNPMAVLIIGNWPFNPTYGLFVRLIPTYGLTPNSASNSPQISGGMCAVAASNPSSTCCVFAGPNITMPSTGAARQNCTAK